MGKRPLYNLPGSWCNITLYVKFMFIRALPKPVSRCTKLRVLWARTSTVVVNIFVYFLHINWWYTGPQDRYNYRKKSCLWRMWNEINRKTDFYVTSILTKGLQVYHSYWFWQQPMLLCTTSFHVIIHARFCFSIRARHIFKWQTFLSSIKSLLWCTDSRTDIPNTVCPDYSA